MDLDQADRDVHIKEKKKGKRGNVSVSISASGKHLPSCCLSHTGACAMYQRHYDNNDGRQQSHLGVNEVSEINSNMVAEAKNPRPSQKLAL